MKMASTEGSGKEKRRDDRPKRPLSAYNLFYRYKRSQILEASVAAGGESLESIHRLIMATPGLEGHPSPVADPAAAELHDLRRERIRAALLANLSPKDTSKRSHRKGSGALSFLEMSRMMSASWKSVDDFGRAIFEELADEGRALYHDRVSVYNEKQASLPAEPVPEKKEKSKPKAPPTPAKKAAAKAGSKRAADKVATSKEAKKSADEDKDDRPKRPLSCYNLFYRYKRAKILALHQRGDETKETIQRLIAAVPGLEDYPPAMVGIGIAELRRSEIRSVLCHDKLLPKDSSQRSHRRTHGAMSFLEMSKIMCDAWKSIDDYGRSIFEELAEEGRGLYQMRVAAYEEREGKKLKLDASPRGSPTPDVPTESVPVTPKSTKLTVSPDAIDGMVRTDVVSPPTPSVSYLGTPANFGMTPKMSNVSAPPLFSMTPKMSNVTFPPPPIFAVSPISMQHPGFYGHSPQELEPLPVFPDMLQGEESGEDEDANPIDLVSVHPLDGCAFKVPAHIPIVRAESNGSEASAEDFMRLVNALDA